MTPTYDAEQPSSFRCSFITQQIFQDEFRSCEDQLIKSDLDCLSPGIKLTDTVVKFYSKILMKSFNDIFILDPHFYTLTLKHPEQKFYYFKNFESWKARCLSIHEMKGKHIEQTKKIHSRYRE